MFIAVFLIGMLFTLGLHTYDKVYTEIEIEASSDDVWKTLTDFESYPVWNTFITKASGQLSVGEISDVTIALPFSKSMDFKLEIADIVEGQEFVWVGETLEKKVLDGEHRFRIESLESGGTKFSQEEKFSGILLYLVLPFIKASVESNFKKMNQALKNRVEGTINSQDKPSELQAGPA